MEVHTLTPHEQESLLPQPPGCLDQLRRGVHLHRLDERVTRHMPSPCRLNRPRGGLTLGNVQLDRKARLLLHRHLPVPPSALQQQRGVLLQLAVLRLVHLPPNPAAAEGGLDALRYRPSVTKAPTLHFTLFFKPQQPVEPGRAPDSERRAGLLAHHQQRREHGLAAENPPHSLFQPQNLQPDFAQKAPPP